MLGIKTKHFSKIRLICLICQIHFAKTRLVAFAECFDGEFMNEFIQTKLKLRHPVRLYFRNREFLSGKNLYPIIGNILGSHMGWKNWKNGKSFSSRGILNRLEKSGDFTQNTGKLSQFLLLFFPDFLNLTVFVK